MAAIGTSSLQKTIAQDFTDVREAVAMELTSGKGFKAIDRLADLGVRTLRAGQPYEAVLLAAAQALIELWLTDSDDNKLELAEQLLDVTRSLVTEPVTSLQQDPHQNNEEEV